MFVKKGIVFIKKRGIAKNLYAFMFYGSSDYSILKSFLVILQLSSTILA